MNSLLLSLLPPSWKIMFYAWWTSANYIMFVYHLFVAWALIMVTNSFLGMKRHFLLDISPGWRIFLTDSSVVVSFLALMGSSGPHLKIEVCLVKLKIWPLGSRLLLAEKYYSIFLGELNTSRHHRQYNFSQSQLRHSQHFTNNPTS